MLRQVPTLHFAHGPGTWRWAVWFGLAMWLVVTVTATAAVATLDEPLADEDETVDPDAGDEVLQAAQGLISDRKTILTLRSLRERLAAGHLDIPGEDFSRLQAADTFSMVPADDGSTFVPLYRALFDLFHKVPRTHTRGIIETQSRAADKLLQRAMRERSIARLPRLIQLFPGTAAAGQAHLVIAKLHLYHGHRFAARGWLVPLTQPKIETSLRQAAVQLLQTIDQPDEPPKTDRSESTDRPRQPSAPVPVATGDTVPQHLAWQFRPFISRALTEQIAAFRNACWQSNVSPLTTWNAVVHDETVFRRTLRGVAAIDLTTGNARWHSQQLPNVDAEITGNSSNAAAFKGLPFDAETFTKLDSSLLATAFCRDCIVGQLSADDQRIYVVAEEPPRPSVVPQSNVFLRRVTRRSWSSTKLVALEKTSGRRVWTIGTSSLTDYLGPGSAGSWFAGPPCVAGRHLLTTLEWDGEMHLGCLAADTGELLWSTPLAVPDQTIDKDTVRRQWSGTPQRHGGLIWIPTTTGHVCCVDELTRSVVWSTHVEHDDPSRELMSGLRGRLAVFTRPASLLERWADARVFYAGLSDVAESRRTDAESAASPGTISQQHRLVLFPHESHDIVLLDAGTGRVDARVPVSPGTIRVYLDRTHVVLAEAAQLRCLRCADGAEVWKQPLKAVGGRPTGRGVVQASLLRIPVSNGSIVTLRIGSGEIVSRSPPLLATRGWGHLLVNRDATGDDLLYQAPDRLLRLSTQPFTADPENALERAMGLVATGHWREAFQLVENIAETDPDFQDAQDLRFQCALQLCLVNSAEYLPQLQALARTAEQIVHVRVLRVTLLIQDQQYEAAADELTEILRLNPSTLNIPTPQLGPPTRSGILPPATAQNVLPTAVRSLQTWATMEFSRLLESWPDAVDSLSQGEPVSVSVLLSLHHPLIRRVLHQRIRQTDSDETAIQLLRHSIRLAEQSAPAIDSDPFSVERSLWNDLRQAVSQRSVATGTALHAAQNLLLTTLRRELPRDFLTDADSATATDVPDIAESDREFRAAMHARCEAWQVQSYQAVPVTQTLSIRRNRTILSAVERDDPFLRRFEWAATSGDVGRLQATDVLAADTAHWSIPGSVQVYGTLSNRQLQRTGSILLLQTYREITAISVLDQRILWRRRMGSASSVNVSSSENFQDYAPERNLLPSQTFYSPYRVVGSNDRWLCLLHERTIETIDTYTGAVLWSVELPSPYTRVRATDAVVIAGAAGRADAMCFDRRSGEPVDIKDAAELAGRAICNDGRLLVCWTRAAPQSPAALQWLDPVTGRVASEVSLGDATWFQFADDRTLCGFQNQSEMLVVNLKTRTRQFCSFRLEADATAADQPQDADATEPGPPEIPLWDPRRLQVASDSLNFYVCNRVGVAAGRFRQPSGHQFLRFESSLRAVGREDGTLRWSVRNDGVLLASTDQPDLPILVLVEDAPINLNPARTDVARNVFRAFTKLSGAQLFEQSVPSRYGLRYAWLETAAPNSLDIAVYGMRIRMQGTAD